MKNHRPTPRPPARPSRDVLDAAIIGLLAAGQQMDPTTDAAADATLAGKLQRTLMQRIAKDCTPRHVTVQAAEDSWHKFLPGIDRKVLHTDGEVMSYLLRIAPGAVLPAHHHPVDEECIVLSGVLNIGTEIVLPAGGFHLGLKGTAHTAITSELGAVIYLRGARPEAELLI